MIEGELLNQISNTGVLGIVLAWFMFRLEKVIKTNTKTLEDVRITLAADYNSKRKREA